MRTQYAAFVTETRDGILALIFNYFVHREMNLKNRTAHFFMKAFYESLTCSAVGVYISPQIRILHTKRFFAHKLKGKPKITITKVWQYLQLQYICHVFSVQLAAMFVYGSTEDDMFDF